jgi:predicted nucleotidyltransferase
MKFYDALLDDFYQDDELEEDIEKHNELNQKLFNGEELKPEVADKVNEIVDLFLADLEEDGIKIDVDDIILVGSNVSYNYTKDSDLDIHIIADTKNLHCPDNLYPLLYGAYKSLFNKKMDIEFYGIPVEIYVETDSTPLRSNGIYSVKENK